MKKILPARALAVAVLITITFTAGPAAAVTSDTYEYQVHSSTNRERVARNLVKVASQSCVDKWAERQARWMASHRSLTHQNLRKVLTDCHMTAVSENIAVGFSTGTKTVAGFMASPGHRKNILTAKMRYIGVGAAKDTSGRWWVSEVFGTKR
jgi:uncharacterized protein YkwD